jgi:hydroxymethylbilane synthase
LEKIVIATRASDLALWQAYYVKDLLETNYPKMEVVINKIVSNGDKVLDKPLALIGGKGHFTKELEDEMLAGHANLAVHSLKDVPTFTPDGLELVAITKREDQSDVFLSHKYKTLDDLPKGAVIGTTSLRRRMQVLKRRPDLQVKDLRGNVNTRLRKLANGEYDAIVLAWIGLHRLDLLKDIPYTQKLPLDLMIPPMGQAALGIEILKGDEELKQIAQSLNDEKSYICSMAERAFISKVGAGCSAPVACNATLDPQNNLTLKAMIGFADGTNCMEETMSVPKDQYQHLGESLAQKMIENGALKILEKAEYLAFKDSRPQRL